jgi:DNA-binding IclR family transcriptional regulator
MTARESLTVNTSALHIFQVLRIFSTARAPMGVAEVSRKLGLPPSTVHRALATLERSEYLTRIENAAKFESGIMPQFLARALFNRYPIRALCLPVLRALAAATGETSGLSVRLGWYRLRIAIVEGPNDIYRRHRVGATTLLHQIPSGQAMLSLCSDEEVERYRRFVRRRRPEVAAEVDKSSFRKELLADRARGFAMLVGAGAEGGGIGLPVRDAAGHPHAGLSVAGPSIAPGGKVDETALAKWQDLRDGLEAQLRAIADQALDPFAHVDPDEVEVAPTGLS